MQEKLIAYANPDSPSGLSIIAPNMQHSPQVKVSDAEYDDEGEPIKPAEFRDETEEEFYARIAEAVPAGVAWKLISRDTVPADRTFRDAWMMDGDAVVLDIDKARNVQRERLRVARVEAFKPLDLESIRANEAGEPLTDIAARKQVLRDAPAHPSIEAATTPEQLKMAGPPELIPFLPDYPMRRAAP